MFDVDQKRNRRNDRWICRDPSEIPIVMKSKYPASLMVLSVLSSDGDVMPPYFFSKAQRLNSENYISILNLHVKPWIESIANGRPYVFQQDSAPAHSSRLTQAWMYQNLHSHWSPDLWPPNSPDCNPLDYYFWGVIEGKVNEFKHASLDDLKAAIIEAHSSIDRSDISKACHSFRGRLEAVGANNGGHIK